MTIKNICSLVNNMSKSKNTKEYEKQLTFIPKLIKFLDGSKGRDKFCKAIQYGSRSVKWYLLNQDPKSILGQRFDGLYSTTSTGRKLWRLGKSLNEYESIKKMLKQPDSDHIVFYLSLETNLHSFLIGF